MSRLEFLELVGILPRERALLAWLADHLEDRDVESVARADADFDWHANRRALSRILEAGGIVEPFDADGSWLNEVCSLTVWSAADADTDGSRREVALAAAILVLAGLPDGPLDGQVFSLSDPVAALVKVVVPLGDAPRCAAAQLLAHALLRAETEDEPDDLFCALGLLLLADGPPDAAPDRVPDEAWQWLIDRESARARAQDADPIGPWLWRLTTFDQSRTTWCELLLDRLDQPPDSPARSTLAEHLRQPPDGGTVP